ncbi:MAG: hypothetical protein OXC14_19800 [Rhodospirillaceae bacterium]|nr:hypothetical protein [Rhodospirillaceae bacterium]
MVAGQLEAVAWSLKPHGCNFDCQAFIPPGVAHALIATLALAALIAAQVVMLNHEPAPESHTPDSVCEFCVAGAGLAGANVGDTKAPVPLSVSLLTYNAVHRVPTNSPLQLHFARAPPTAS